MADETFAQRILILFAHPALEKSRVNRRLIRGVHEMPGITFHDLYQVYPDFNIFPRREQELVEAHDVIIFQHPFYWYSTPAILKEWQDIVLEHGWAFGSTATALHGKKALSIITAGGRESAYQEGGFNGYTMQQLLAPVDQTFRLCGVEYLPPFVVHGTHSKKDDEFDGDVADYNRFLKALRDGRIDYEAAAGVRRLNADLDAIIRPEVESDAW